MSQLAPEHDSSQVVGGQTQQLFNVRNDSWDQLVQSEAAERRPFILQDFNEQ